MRESEARKLDPSIACDNGVAHPYKHVQEF